MTKKVGPVEVRSARPFTAAWYVEWIADIKAASADDGLELLETFEHHVREDEHHQMRQAIKNRRRVL